MIEGSGSVPLTNGSGSMRHNKAQKHTDTTDPDPQHWNDMCVLKYSGIVNTARHFNSVKEQLEKFTCGRLLEILLLINHQFVETVQQKYA